MIMVKKLFLFAFALAFLGITNANAQLAKQSRNSMLSMPSNVNKSESAAKIEPASDNEKWYGHYNTTMNRLAVGIQKAEPHDMAFHIKGTDAVAVGKKIKAFRFYLRGTNGIKDVKIWLSKKLPGNVSEADFVQSIPEANLVGGDESEKKPGKANDVALSTPYEVTSEGVYVGLSFVVTSAESEITKFPVVTGDADGVEEGLLLRTGTTVSEWTDFSKEGLGFVAINVMLEGEFATNGVAPMPLENVMIAANKEKTIDLTAVNAGSAGVKNLDYTITTGGNTSAEKHVDLTTPVTILGGSFTFPITLQAGSETGNKEYTVTITKVNGVDNEASNKECKVSAVIIKKEFKRGVLVEEFTGTGCGYCPRGLVGMEKLSKKYGDAFVGIGIHQYNTSDPMYLTPANYEKLGWKGAPKCMINRGKQIDPYKGSGGGIFEDFEKELTSPALGIELEGLLSEDNKSVKASAKIESLVSGKHSIVFVLIANGLTGTTASWKQSNYYAQNDANSLPSDLAKFGRGGEFGQDKFTYVFDDVAIASSFKNMVNTATLDDLVAGATTESKFTLDLPKKEILLNALKMDKLFVAAFVLDSEGKVMNAAKAAVKAITDGIENTNVSAKNITEIARYTVDGRLINAPQSGINIVKMSDGSIIKVLVK